MAKLMQADRLTRRVGAAPRLLRSRIHDRRVQRPRFGTPEHEPTLATRTRPVVDEVVAQHTRDRHVANARLRLRTDATETFGDTKSPSEIRRRQLMLDLSKAKRPVPRIELRELSPAVAAAYASKTTKTLSRDLNALNAEMGLIRPERFRDQNGRPRLGWVPNREIIEAFLPERTVGEAR
jgi:hypothetical protein